MDIDPEIRLPVPGAAWIPLSKGLWALVDDWLVEGMPKFWANTAKHRNAYYGQREYKNGDAKVYEKLHHWVWRQYNSPLPIEIDHINGFGWDNRGCNLRAATEMENTRNKPIYKNNTSGYKGVSWCKQKERWMTCISVERKLKRKFFDTAIEAALEYDRLAKEYFKEFARLNFPDF